MPISNCSKKHRRMTQVHQKDNGTGQTMEKCFYCIHTRSQPDTQPDTQPDHQYHSAQTQGRRMDESRRQESARPGAHSRRRKARGAASEWAVCVHIRDDSRVTVLIGDCAHGRMVCHSRTYNGLRQVGCTQPSTQSATQVGQHSNQPSVNCEQP